MKLYDVPRDSRIQLSNGMELNFKRIDGMYSLCLTDDNEPVHVAAWTEVAVIDGGTKGRRSAASAEKSKQDRKRCDEIPKVR